MKVKASIDIGSNSTLLLVAEDNNGLLKELHKQSYVTALGRDLDKNGSFLEESMDATFSALSEYGKKAKELGVPPEKIIATATEASRVASNSKDFYEKVEAELGIQVKIITSEAEAYYSARGVLFENISDPEIIIMDIGGASTELIKVQTKPFKIIETISLPFGAVRVTDWIQSDQVDEKLLAVFSKYETKPYVTKKLFCVAGTMTSVANMHLGHKKFIEDEVHNHCMMREQFLSLVEENKQFNEQQFLDKYPFLGKRARTIKGGMVVASSIFDKCSVESIIVSTYGLRYGTLIEGEIKDGFISR